MEGRFAEGIDPDERTVYLIAQRHGKRKILDSVRLTGNGFTLRGAVSRRGDSCRVEFSGTKAGFGLLLRPNTTVRMQIAAALPDPAVFYLRGPTTNAHPTNWTDSPTPSGCASCNSGPTRCCPKSSDL